MSRDLALLAPGQALPIAPLGAFERRIRNRTQYLVRRADSRFHPSVARNERPLRNRVTIFVHEMGPVVYGRRRICPNSGFGPSNAPEGASNLLAQDC